MFILCIFVCLSLFARYSHIFCHFRFLARFENPLFENIAKKPHETSFSDMSDQPPNDGGGGAQPAPEQPSMPVLDVYNFACQFMAQNGWYMLFAFVIFCLIKKNVDAYLLVSLFHTNRI